MGNSFRYTIENLGQGQYAPVSLQKWIIVNLEDNNQYKIYESRIIKYIIFTLV